MVMSAGRFACVVQDRDIEILTGLFESRVMTAAHIATLYFDRSREAAKKRLQKLKAGGLIGERIRRVNQPSILFLTRKGLNMLHEEGRLSGYPDMGLASFEKRIPVSDLTLRHELQVMDVKAAFHAAVQDIQGTTVEEFSTWPLLYQFLVPGRGFDVARPVKPDGFLRIREQLTAENIAEHSYFLEVDRSSETLDTLTVRAGLYLDYYRSGGFAVRNGGQAGDFKTFPFRILIVFTNEERRNNVAERLLQADQPILSLAWLSTFNEVTRNPFGAIWIQPAHYRQALAGTQYDPERQAARVLYRRRSTRESFVNECVKKLSLLEE